MAAPDPTSSMPPSRPRRNVQLRNRRTAPATRRNSASFAEKRKRSSHLPDQPLLVFTTLYARKAARLRPLWSGSGKAAILKKCGENNAQSSSKTNISVGYHSRLGQLI